MLDVLQGFIHELRSAGLPVSMTENLDAMRAVEHIDIADRDEFRTALGATLVKHHRHWPAFETVFDVYFSLYSHGVEADDPNADEWAELAGQDGQAAGGGPGGELSREELAQLLLDALMSMDRDQLRRLAAAAVQAFAGMEPGRPVGGTYYLYRTLRQLDLDDLAARLVGRAREEGDVPDDPLAARLQEEEFQRRLRVLRQLVESEIRRRLVADRGIEAMARTLRKPLPEDVDFMHASREELLALRKALQPLTRKLAVRLARKRRHGRKGPLDFRNTMRHSLSYGGVPADPKFKFPRPAKPEIIVLADISGSVAAFARFTLHLVYAISSQFSKVRSWVFIDGIDEVTSYFEGIEDIGEAVHRVNTEADVIWVDGHSDYGHAFDTFWKAHARDVSPKSTVLLLGDARNNYHASNAWIVAEMRKKARHVYWLNPEPRSYWDTGDSIVGEYGTHCDGVYECRNLRQLERFVDILE